MKKISEEQIAAIYRKAWVPVRDLPPTYLGKEDGKLYDATGKMIPWSGFAGIVPAGNPFRESWLYRQWKKFRGED